MSKITTTVRSCARCGGDHAALEFLPISNPAPDFTHWAMCPTVHQPIIMLVKSTFEVTEIVPVGKDANSVPLLRNQD